MHIVSNAVRPSSGMIEETDLDHGASVIVRTGLDDVSPVPLQRQQ
jgi:hypothetical protein